LRTTRRIWADTSADGFRPIAPAEMEQKEPLAIPSAVTVISRSR
jgi:hypothetical protein